jgi:hypothetical protein
MMDDTAQLATCIFCNVNIAKESVFTGMEGVAACRPCLVKADKIIRRINVNYQCDFCGKTVPANKLVEAICDLHLCEECVESGLSPVQEADGESTGLPIVKKTPEFVICTFCGQRTEGQMSLMNSKDDVACQPCLVKAADIIRKINADDRCCFCRKVYPGNKLVESMGGLYMCVHCIESGLSAIQQQAENGSS